MRGLRELITILPLLYVGFEMGRVLARLDSLDQRLERIENKVLVQVNKLDHDAGIFGTSFGVSQKTVLEVMSGQSVIFDMTLFSRDTIQDKPTGYQSDLSCLHDNLTTVFWLKSLINPSG